MQHVNRYITALLVVLAATGMEAQTYESALKATLGIGNIENICLQSEFKGLEAEILEIIRTVRHVQSKLEQEPSPQAQFVVQVMVATCQYKQTYSHPIVLWNELLVGSSINIRAPSDC